MLQIPPPSQDRVKSHPENERQRLLETVLERWQHIQYREEDIAQGGRSTLADAIAGGEALNRIKHSTDLPHGDWMKWTAENLPQPFSHSKAVEWMRVYRYQEQIRGAANIREALRMIDQIKRKKQRDDLRANPPRLPDGRFGLIIADPPWDIQGVEYPVLSIREICNYQASGRRIADLAADDAVLLLWRVCKYDQEAHDVIKAWGFEYSGRKLVWIKDRANTQHPWLPGRHEDCLIARRGKPTILLGGGDDVIGPLGQRRRHSEKPQAIFDRAEQIVPMGPEHRLELFARRRRPGWVTWGNEV